LMDGLTPHQRYRRSQELLAQGFNRPTTEEAPLQQRGGLLPFGQYEGGRAGFAWPGMVAEPVNSLARLLQRGYQPGTNDVQGVEDAFNVAGAAMTGGLLAPRPAASIGMSGRPTGLMPRAVDDLGYYSQALEAAKAWGQGKGTPEQALMWLKKSGVKDAEIEATGLRQAIEGQKSITRDDLVRHLEGNRVGLRESQYGGEQAYTASKWSSYSLDPSNPTYRETVLHLPDSGASAAEAALREKYGADYIRKASSAELEAIGAQKKTDFQSGHFSEPNIVGHMMTSMVKHRVLPKDMEAKAGSLLAQADALQEDLKRNPVWGDARLAREKAIADLKFKRQSILNQAETKPVYLIDQIQSDWGQKLRDGGVRDEAKIQELRKRFDEADLRYRRESGRHPSDPIRAEAEREHSLLRAELRTAEAATSGHPLVNTTDQWVNTTLRRGLNQAVEGGADYMAIPSGNTVLGYNPGDAHGMNTFYNQIVPKNLLGLMRKGDKSISPIRADQLETPAGMKGQGFSLLPITDDVRAYVRSGQPLFMNPITGTAIPATLGQYYGQDRGLLP